ncbi:UBA/TS-N domain containing protein [Purpureocillium lavendulum]|uniref:UBA/TS-N domain containing protein n=1 Tax=Purpureocillium lavendulum TaxID=1247861 RepID=A0AB34FF56_9HYPO|nr:UBA/TS-N domain containing protein [Purpureocillium lavendulum]
MAIFVAYIDGGGCLVLPSTLPYSAEELKWMTSRCGLTTLNMFSGFLSKLFTEARVDDSLLQALQAFDHVIYSGLPLPAKDEHWAQEQGINMMNVFGSTEAGPMLRSPRTSTKQASLGLTPFPTTAYKFIPASDGMDANNIFELVITAQSPDCPHPTLRNSETGDFHTGDLFTKCKNGNYLPAGRLDDWIKLESAVRCDTQSLEQKVTETCGEDLVDIAIVIGTGRPLPVLVVEPKKGVNMSSGDLQAELLRRIGEFQSQRYIHERIDSPDRVLVVPNNSIPRVMTAKGSLRRQDVEDAFQETLNTIFTHSS